MTFAGRARATIDIPAGASLYAALDADGTPRLVVEVDDVQVRFVLPNSEPTVEALGAVDRFATAAARWKQAIWQLATDQGVLPL